MAEANTDSIGRLDLNDAISSILVEEDIKKNAPSENEVTEEAVSTEEAVVTESQADSTNVDTEIEESEEPVEEPEEESEEEEAEEEPEEESDEAEKEPEEEDEPFDLEVPDNHVLFTDQDGNEVTVEESKRGYLRQSDYTKKTQALAEEKTKIQEVANQVGAERQTLAENLNLALNVVEPQLAELARTNWDQLASEDPYEYAEKRALFDQAQVRYQQLSKTAQNLVQQEKAQQGHSLKAKLTAETRSLAMAIPDMADPKKGKALRNEIKEYAMSALGLNEQEASTIYDHRMIIALNKARQFDQLEASSLSAARKKVSKTPKKVIRSGKPVTKSEKQQQAQKQKVARLKASGSVDDAVNLLLGS